MAHTFTSRIIFDISRHVKPFLALIGLKSQFLQHVAHSQSLWTMFFGCMSLFRNIWCFLTWDLHFHFTHFSSHRLSLLSAQPYLTLLCHCWSPLLEPSPCSISLMLMLVHVLMMFLNVAIDLLLVSRLPLALLLALRFSLVVWALVFELVPVLV